MPHVHSLRARESRTCRAEERGYLQVPRRIAKRVQVVADSIQIHRDHCCMLKENVHTASVAVAKVKSQNLIGPKEYNAARRIHRAAGIAKHEFFLDEGDSSDDDENFLPDGVSTGLSDSDILIELVPLCDISKHIYEICRSLAVIHANYECQSDQVPNEVADSNFQVSQDLDDSDREWMIACQDMDSSIAHSQKLVRSFTMADWDILSLNMDPTLMEHSGLEFEEWSALVLGEFDPASLTDDDSIAILDVDFERYDSDDYTGLLILKGTRSNLLRYSDFDAADMASQALIYAGPALAYVLQPCLLRGDIAFGGGLHCKTRLLCAADCRGEG